MTTTNRLFYTVSKRYIQAGTAFKINIAFGEYKDGLCKDGIISQSLYERATLY